MLDYTNCDSASSVLSSPTTPQPNIKRWMYDQTLKVCTIEFELIEPITATVHLYLRYSNLTRLTNFYQNHRLYLKSLSPEQLQGTFFKTATEIKQSQVTDCSFLLFANCDRSKKLPNFNNFMSDNENNPDCRNPDDLIKNSAEEAQYYPCGLIANSFFTDTLTNDTLTNQNGNEIVFSTDDIAWPEDESLYKATPWKDNFSDDDSKYYIYHILRVFCILYCLYFTDTLVSHPLNVVFETLAVAETFATLLL
jgi:hypothetical protein